MATLYSRVPHTLGVSHLEAVEGDLANLMLDYEEDFLWLDEILEACKKALVTPEVELLPKTPSSKKPRRRIVKKKKEIETESDADDEEGTPPSRKTRQTARQKVLYNKENKTKEPARKTRGKKQNSGSSENPRQKISPKLTSTNLSKMSDCSELELSDAEMTPVAKSTSRSTLNKTAIGVANQSKNSPYNKEKYSVKQRASAYEEMLGKRSSHSPAVTPVNKNKHCISVDNTPEYNTPDTVKHSKTVSCLDKANVENLNESIIKEKTAQKRRSSRKSLKVLSSKVKRLSVHGHHNTGTRLVEAEYSEEVTEVIEEPKRKPRTRLRLKKKEQIEMSTDESESTCTSIDKDSTKNDADENKNESKDTVTTYQSPVKKDGTPVPRPRTSKSTCRTPLKSENESCDEIMKPVSKKNSMDKACSSESEVVMDTGSSDDCDTGLKTRRGSRGRKDSSHRDRDSGISGVLSAQSSAVSLKNLEMDNEKTINHDSLKPTRSTRSQSKQYQQSPILEGSNTDEVFHTPEVSEPKNNRKRQVDDCEEVSSAPKSKRSCTGIQQDANTHEEPENELHDGPKTPGRASLDSDQYESMENDSDDYTSPKHRPKIVRPVGLNNSACRSANRPTNLLSGFVNSFVKRNTPVKALSIDQKKREIMEKEKKNEDRVQRKREMLNKQMQERKRLFANYEMTKLVSY
ncbi:inner centromere protein [Patella vulgata]|uniref:inner centromere protein n=1 Tax=Patella vulgata TaxID=6465 RepID=UPI0024A8CA50|nr:inner centromere protein [Patella vulgata]